MLFTSSDKEVRKYYERTEEFFLVLFCVCTENVGNGRDWEKQMKKKNHGSEIRKSVLSDHRQSIYNKVVRCTHNADHRFNSHDNTWSKLCQPQHFFTPLHAQRIPIAKIQRTIQFFFFNQLWPSTNLWECEKKICRF